MALSQAGLSRTWWKDAANHFVYGRTRLPLREIDSKTSHELFYRRQGMVERLRPFGRLVFVHLQKDQRGFVRFHRLSCGLQGVALPGPTGVPGNRHRQRRLSRKPFSLLRSPDCQGRG